MLLEDNRIESHKGAGWTIYPFGTRLSPYLSLIRNRGHSCNLLRMSDLLRPVALEIHQDLVGLKTHYLLLIILPVACAMIGLVELDDLGDEACGVVLHSSGLFVHRAIVVSGEAYDIV